MNLDILSLLEAGARQGDAGIDTRLPPLLMWGDFIFQLSTLAFNKLTISDSWNWVSQSRIGRRDTLQYTGKKAPTLRFDCELYADFVDITGLDDLIDSEGVGVDADPVEWLRRQASSKTPMMLVTGYGRVMGFWVLTQLDQAVDAFQGAGEFRHQTVTISLQYYGGSLSGVDDDPAEVDTGSTTQSTQAVSDFQAFMAEQGNG